MNDLAVLIGIVSLPGLIAAIICDRLVVHSKQWTAFKYTKYTFIFGVFSYFAVEILVRLLSAVDRRLPFLGEETSLRLWQTLLSSNKHMVWGEIFWATFFSPVVAAAAVFVVNRKLINKLAQRLRLSQKYGDENLFGYYLNSPDLEWVYVRDIKNNLSYRGRINSFSENETIQELLLLDVTVFDYQSSDELYCVKSLYLAQGIGSFIIETAVEEEKKEKADDNERHKVP